MGLAATGLAYNGGFADAPRWTKPLHPAELTAALADHARHLGFDQVAACPAVEATGTSRLAQWLEAGYAGEMQWLADRQAAYAHPRHVLDGVRGMLMLATIYRTQEPTPCVAGQGRVSRYAWGSDYHDVLHERLHGLADELRRLAPGARARGVVDTAPLLEREYALLAGLGWIGKHTLLLNREQGSWFFLSALLTDQELAPDRPPEVDHCGACRACLDACPTGAFVQPYVLDARRCISYLTIEHRSAIPVELRPGIGDWLLGCDVCQEVCPWNRRAAATDEPAFQPVANADPVDLIALFELDDEAFRRRFRHTPLWRPKRRGLLRNAAIILGNRPAPAALPALVRGLRDAEPLVRGACAWALSRYPDEQARQALCERMTLEEDAEVHGEIVAALGGPARVG
jgi:epoxyqueuosine reductase